MNLGELVGGAVVVWVVGSQIRGMVRSASKRAADSGVATASALMREALAERAATVEAPNLREILAAARQAQATGSAPAQTFDVAKGEGLVNVLETAREIARQAREHRSERVDLQTLANAARAAGANVVIDESLATQRGKKKRSKQEQPRAHHDLHAAHGGMRQPLQALGAMPPMRELHPIAATPALAPMSPLTPYV